MENVLILSVWLIKILILRCERSEPRRMLASRTWRASFEVLPVARHLRMRAFGVKSKLRVGL